MTGPLSQTVSTGEIDSLTNAMATIQLEPKQECLLFRLPRDIFVHLGSFFDEASDIVSFSLTCRRATQLRPLMMAANTMLISDWLYHQIVKKKPERIRDFLNQADSQETYPTQVHLRVHSVWQEGFVDLLQTIQQKFPNITTLYITDPNLKVQVIQALFAACPRLQNVVLFKMTQDGVCSLQFPATTRLVELIDTPVTNRVLSHIFSSTLNVESLVLRDLPYSVTEMPPMGNLKELVLSEVTFLDEEFERLMTAAPSLQRLQISDCKAISTNGFKAITQKNLRSFYAGSCRIDKANLERIFAANTQLTEVHLPNVRCLEAEEFCTMNYPSSLRLATLDSTKITPDGLQNLFSKCSALQELSINSCDSIAESTLERLTFPRLLTTLEVGGKRIMRNQH